MEMHYVNSGVPYTPTETYVDFFGGYNHTPANYVYPSLMHQQENLYWSMNGNPYRNPYRFEVSELGSSYYGSYAVNEQLPRTEVNRRTWEYSSSVHVEEPASTDMQYEEETAVTSVHDSAEECLMSEQDEDNAEVLWQDDLDPDNMTYEELLELGEAVGTQSRGLSTELIKSLPTSRYKAGSFFSRKKSKERCVICLLTYKIGEQQITLPCKHVYHKKCGTKWLSINKNCPVCNVEVFGSELRD